MNVKQGVLLYLGLISFNVSMAQIKGTDDRRQNIIFILTDDHRWDALGAMGNTIIQTPNLDALAKKGTLYKNAYVTTAICCVSRASILTGQYQSRHKINDFTTDFSPAATEQTYPVLLKRAGYITGFVGKYGVGLNPPVDLFDYWSCTKKVQPDYELVSKSGKIVHNTDSVTSDVLKFLDEFGQRGPFCLSVGFKAPHELDGPTPRFIVQERFKSLYADVKIPVPETAQPRYWNSFPDFFRTEENIARVRWRTFFSTDELYQQSVKDYYRLISGVDEAVGKIVSKLEQAGLSQNTIVIFTGDNGFYLGEHGMEGKWYGHEESIRVPLIICEPREKQKGSVETEIALNIDIAPTILKAAGLEVPAQMQGRDLLTHNAAPKSFFYEHTFMGSPRIPKVEGIVSPRFKYMRFIEHGFEELYDIKNDPHETTNLATHPGYQERIRTLRAAYQKQKIAVR